MARIEKIKTKTEYGKPYVVLWSWYDTATQPATRKFRKERFRTLAEAKSRKREVEQSTADGNMLDYMAGKATLTEWAERWYRVERVNWKPSTARGYRMLLDSSVLPALGHKRIRSITTGDVEDFIYSLTQPNAQGKYKTPPTIRHHFVVLRSVLDYAAHTRAVAINPARGVKLPTDTSTGRVKPEQRFLTEQEVANVANALDHTDPYPLMVRFMAYTGLRAGEVAGLNVADVDLAGRVVTVRRTRRKVKASDDVPDGWEVHVPKSGKPRRVPILTVKLADDLRAYLAQHPNRTDPEAPLWPGRVNGGQDRFKGSKGAITYDQPWERGAFYARQFKPALIKAGVPAGVRIHDLRHTFASICHSKGIEAAQVADWMGHANEVITKTIYTHLFAADTQRYMDLFDEPEAAPSNVTPLTRARRA